MDREIKKRGRVVEKAIKQAIKGKEITNEGLASIKDGIKKAADNINENRGRKREQTINNEIEKAAKTETRVTPEDAINMAADSHQKIADCNRGCIVAQLKEHYQKAGCKDMRPTTKNEQNKAEVEIEVEDGIK